MSSKTVKLTLGTDTRKRVISSTHTSFSDMQALVAECFSSQLADYNYILSYIDADKDKITITCDAELHVSLAEEQDPLRLTIEKAPPAPPFAAPGGPLEIHENVTCDGCGMGPIVGPRFKCSVRNDYDLCLACEAVDASGHPLLKIKKPADAPAAIICVQHDEQPDAEGAAAGPSDEDAQTAEDLLNRILQGDGEVTLADLVGVGVGGCKPLRKALRQLLFKNGGGGGRHGGRGGHFAPRRCGPWAGAGGFSFAGPNAPAFGAAPAPPPPPHWRPRGPMRGPGSWRRAMAEGARQMAEAQAAPAGMSEEEAVAHAVEASIASAPKKPQLCARFVKHLSFADKTPITSGSDFVKTWGLRNDGELPLPAGCALYNVGGDSMSGAEGAVTIGDVPAGAEFTISLPLKAPEEPGRYVGYWRLTAPDAAGRGPFFGHRLGVDVLVEPQAEDFEVVESATEPANTGLRARLAELGFTEDAVQKAIDEVGEAGTTENAVNFLISGGGN